MAFADEMHVPFNDPWGREQPYRGAGLARSFATTPSIWAVYYRRETPTGQMQLLTAG